jgi:hypothetical protein
VRVPGLTVTAVCRPHIAWLEGVAALSTPAGRGHALAVDRCRVTAWDFDDTGAITARSAVDQDKVSTWAAWWSPALAARVYAVGTGEAGESALWLSEGQTAPDRAVAGQAGGQGPLGTRIPLGVSALAAAPGQGGASVVVAEADGTVSEVVREPGQRWLRVSWTRCPDPVFRLCQAPGQPGHLALDVSGSVALITQEDGHAAGHRVQRDS